MKEKVGPTSIISLKIRSLPPFYEILTSGSVKGWFLTNFCDNMDSYGYDF